MRTAMVAAAGFLLSLAAGAAAAQTTAPAGSGPPAVLARHDTVPAFDAPAIDGTITHVDYPKGSSTVLLFFLSSCPTCHKMIPLWNSAYERKAKGLRVFGLMLDQEPAGFFMATPIAFPVLRVPGRTSLERRAFTDRFKVQQVPVTVRVAAGGKVEDVGQGLLDLIRTGEIFRPPE